MRYKPRNPINPIHGIEFERPGAVELYKFESTLKDMKNEIKKNIFSQDQINRINRAVANVERTKYFNSKNRGQGYTVGWELPEDVRQVVQSIAKEATGTEWLIADMALCTYKNSEGIPELKMHRDENFDSQRICFDYQLDSNTSWDIVVGEDIYELEDNSGILFSSTDQFHGRPVKEFKDEDYIKLIFFHMSEDGKPDSNKGDQNILVD
jgi:hypothetical protein